MQKKVIRKKNISESSSCHVGIYFVQDLILISLKYLAYICKPTHVRSFEGPYLPNKSRQSHKNTTNHQSWSIMRIFPINKSFCLVISNLTLSRSSNFYFLTTPRNSVDFQFNSHSVKFVFYYEPHMMLKFYSSNDQKLC